MGEHIWVEFRLQFAFVTVSYDQFAFIIFYPLWYYVEWVGDTVNANPVWQVGITTVLLRNLLVVVIEYSKIASALYTRYVIQANGAVFKTAEAMIKCLVVILTRLANFFASSGRFIPFVFWYIAMIFITVCCFPSTALGTTLMAAFTLRQTWGFWI
jgi:hypothetical protein